MIRYSRSFQTIFTSYLFLAQFLLNKKAFQFLIFVPLKSFRHNSLSTFLDFFNLFQQTTTVGYQSTSPMR